MLVKKSVLRLCSCTLILLALLAGCGSGGGRADSGASSEPPEVSEPVTLVQIQVIELAPLFSNSALQPRTAGLLINAENLQLIVSAPDLPEYVETIPLTTGQGVFSIPAGTARTFRVETRNQRDQVIYQSPPQTVDLAPEATVALQFDLAPIETAFPVVEGTQILPDTASTIHISDPSSPVQGLRLAIPAGAITQTMTVTVDEIYNLTQVPPPPSQASPIIDLGPSGSTFIVPITLEFPYDETRVTALGIPETELQVRRFNPTQGAWLPLPAQTIDPESNIITLPLTGFSLYAITGGATNSGDGSTEPTPPSPPVNQPPVVTVPTSQTSRGGDTIALPIVASDPDGDALAYSTQNLPPGLSLDPTTGVISGIISDTAAAASPFAVTVTVTDGVASATAAITWTVAPQETGQGDSSTAPAPPSTAEESGQGDSSTEPTPPSPPVNQPPVVTVPTPQTSKVGDTIVLPIVASDPDGDALAYSTQNLPPGLSLDPTTGVISGIISDTAAAASPFAVTVTVTDGVASATAAVTWTVLPPATGQIELAWEVPSMEEGTQPTDLMGYRLYFGRTSRGTATDPSAFAYDAFIFVDDPDTTTVTLSNLEVGQTYYLAITALYTFGESAFSNELSAIIPAPLAVAALAPIDSDGDGLSDDSERNVYGTDPTLKDTDGDGVDDGDEVAFWEKAHLADLDDDGLINLLDPDADNDGFPDGIEIRQGYNPADPASKPQADEWTDYRVRLTLQSDDENAIGVMFRYQDNENYYRFEWDNTHTVRRLLKRQGGVFTLLAEDTTPYVPGQPYQVEVVVQGSILEVVIDGNVIFSVTDADIPAGTIALYTSGNQGSYFDDVQVEDLTTNTILLADAFDDGGLNGWAIIDEGTIAVPSVWSATHGMLTQSAKIPSTPATNADLTTPGTFALYAD